LDFIDQLAARKKVLNRATLAVAFLNKSASQGRTRSSLDYRDNSSPENSQTVNLLKEHR
jgi:hypothetical protein